MAGVILAISGLFEAGAAVVGIITSAIQTGKNIKNAINSAGNDDKDKLGIVHATIMVGHITKLNCYLLFLTGNVSTLSTNAEMWANMAKGVARMTAHSNMSTHEREIRDYSKKFMSMDATEREAAQALGYQRLQDAGKTQFADYLMKRMYEDTDLDTNDMDLLMTESMTSDVISDDVGSFLVSLLKTQTTDANSREGVTKELTFKSYVAGKKANDDSGIDDPPLPGQVAASELRWRKQTGDDIMLEGLSHIADEVSYGAPVPRTIAALPTDTESTDVNELGGAIRSLIIQSAIKVYGDCVLEMNAKMAEGKKGIVGTWKGMEMDAVRTTDSMSGAYGISAEDEAALRLRTEKVLQADLSFLMTGTDEQGKVAPQEYDYELPFEVILPQANGNFKNGQDFENVYHLSSTCCRVAGYFNTSEPFATVVKAKDAIDQSLELSDCNDVNGRVLTCVVSNVTQDNLEDVLKGSRTTKFIVENVTEITFEKRSILKPNLKGSAVAAGVLTDFSGPTVNYSRIYYKAHIDVKHRCKSNESVFFLVLVDPEGWPTTKKLGTDGPYSGNLFETLQSRADFATAIFGNVIGVTSFSTPEVQTGGYFSGQYTGSVTVKPSSKSKALLEYVDNEGLIKRLTEPPISLIGKTNFKEVGIGSDQETKTIPFGASFVSWVEEHQPAASSWIPVMKAYCASVKMSEFTVQQMFENGFPSISPLTAIQDMLIVISSGMYASYIEGADTVE